MSGQRAARHGVPAWGGSTIMTCRTAVGMLFDFLERSLRPSAHGDVQSHLDRCAPCACFMETYRRTTALCRRAWNRRAPPELEGRLLSHLRDKTGGQCGASRKSG